MAHRKPTPETLAFGAEVARLRGLAKLSRAELAKKVPISLSYVGLVESGCTRCRYDFAQRLDKALDTGTTLADAWDDWLRGTAYPRYFVDFTKAESGAAILRSYQAFVVYGLLQTEAYARVMVVTDSAVAGRMKRQGILTRDDPPMVSVVMNESVLYSQVGDSTVMREQLEHLITVSRLPNVTLQIAPTGYYRGVHGSFTVATQPTGTEVVHLANLTGATITYEPGDIVYAVKSFALLQACALSPDMTRDMIRKVVDDRWTS
jgi:transcriptional regulator with XRE-family HTH domain